MGGATGGNFQLLLRMFVQIQRTNHDRHTDAVISQPSMRVANWYTTDADIDAIAQTVSRVLSELTPAL